jgi:putative transposase
LSDERKVDPPHLARKAEKRIRRLNRERDRRRMGGINRRRTVERLARAHRAIRQKRIDHMHKITRELVDTYQGFAVETLSLRGLARTRMAKSFADAGLGEALRALRYKALWAGREWREMPRFQRSTGVCPPCGTMGPKLSLSVRIWACKTCGAVHDRDVAAARIILDRAVGQALPEPAGAVRRKRGAVGSAGARPPGRARRPEPPTNVAEVVHD